MTPTLDPPAQPSALPSPPTSPTSPRTTATRIRIKAPRRPGSLGNVSLTHRSESHAERTRSTSPSTSRMATAESGTPGSEIRSSTNMAASKRRQSSIAYYTPSSPNPWSQRPQLNRTFELESSLDGPHNKSAVANGKENMSKRSSLVLSSRSPSTRESVSSLDAVCAREREPITLVEKYADLLHFIAQKERKCLELRDQLAAHEKELAELKQKWERIINYGHEPVPNPSFTAGVGSVALDGLKEGVRMITAGFSDLSGVIQELESSDKDPSKPKPLIHTSRESKVLDVNAKRADREYLSMSSMSCIQESVHDDSDRVFSDEKEPATMTMTMTVATAPSLSHAGSLNHRVHRRTSRVISGGSTTPTSGSVSPLTQSPNSTDLDVGMSLVLAPSPTLVPPMLGALSASATPLPVVGSTPTAAGPVLSWIDSVGKKLNDLQKGQTFSKSQKRASLLLAGVSNTISSALSPGPTATTPAPVPVSTSTTTVATPRLLSSTTPSGSTKPFVTSRPPSTHSHSQFESRPYPSYKSMMDWLDDDDEQTVHAGGVLIPDSKVQPRHTRPSEMAATTVALFDDDWNW